ARVLGHALQRPFDSVKDIVQASGSKGHRDRIAARNDFLSRPEACGLLVYLNGGEVFIKSDDLADELLAADVDHFRHTESRVSLQVNDGSVDSIDSSGLKQCRHLLKTKIYHTHCGAVS